MRKHLHLIISLWALLLTLTMKAQDFYVGSGSTFTVPAGVSITVGGNYTDNRTTPTIEGSLYLKGSTAQSYSGNAMTVGEVLTIDNSNGVSIGAAFNVTGSLVFTNGKVTLDGPTLTLGVAATVTGAGSEKYVVLKNNGQLVKQFSANGSFDYPVGADATNYSPISLMVSGSSYAGGAGVAATVVAEDHPGRTARHTDYAKRYWPLTFTGITDPSVNYTATYVAGDVTGTAANIAGSYYQSTPEWFYTNAAAGSNTISGSLSATGTALSADVFGQSPAIKVNAKVLLQGPYNSGTGLMNTTLKTNGLLPVNQPYTSTFSSANYWNYAGTESRATLPAAMVDWVLLELRSDITTTTVNARSAAVLLNDGTLKDGFYDGPPEVIATPGSYYIIVRHRNHLPVASATAQNLPNSTAYDFTTAVTQEYGNKMASLGNGKYGMYRGNVIPDNVLRASGLAGVNDWNKIYSTLGNTLYSSVYNIYDVNLDGVARNTGLSSVNDRAMILSVLGVSTNIISQSFTNQ